MNWRVRIANWLLKPTDMRVVRLNWPASANTATVETFYHDGTSDKRQFDIIERERTAAGNQINSIRPLLITAADILKRKRGQS